MSDGWLKNLFGKRNPNSASFSPADTNSNSSTPILVIPQRQKTIVIGPVQPAQITPPNRPYWDERGWKIIIGTQETRYTGSYRVLNKASGQTDVFSGMVIFKRSRANPYILRPPDQIRRHPKWPCFRRITDGWFRIEWFRAARHPDEAILYVESILSEVINGNNKKTNSRRR